MTETLEIDRLILAEHEDFRRRFAELDRLRIDGADEKALGALWGPLADLLEVHAAAEEEIFYPVLLKHGSDDAEEETDDAIGDHNDIRDAIREATAQTAGSDAWWAAVGQCREANDEHLGEEERDVIPDFRGHSDQETRTSLGRRWLAFHEEHAGARGIDTSDKDPKEYIEENS